DKLRQRRLPRARRPIENDAGQAIRFQHPPEKLAGSQEMLLANKFLQRPRPHPHRQRRRLVEIFLPRFLEEVHGGIVAIVLGSLSVVLGSLSVVLGHLSVISCQWRWLLFVGNGDVS